MNRTLSCVTVLAMILAAVGVCVKQTIEFSEAMESSTLAASLGIEGVAAGILIASSISLLRKRYARQKKPLSRRPIPAIV